LPPRHHACALRAARTTDLVLLEGSKAAQHRVTDGALAGSVEFHIRSLCAPLITA
jgi:hypothetical protein